MVRKLSYAEDDPKLFFVPIAEAIVPPVGLIEHIKDRWWIVHPTKGLVFYSKHMSPQCNKNEDLTRIWAAGGFPWAEVQFIPSVFRKINPHDYV